MLQVISSEFTEILGEISLFFKGPLYFEALHCIKGQDDRIAHEVLEKNVDLSLKDEVRLYNFNVQIE